MKKKIAFHKLFHWEYWPSYMFYIPNLPLAIYLAIKAKNPVFFTATNPAIQNSGNGMESKFETLQLIPEKFRPLSVLSKPTDSFEDVLTQVKNKQISFPLIAKPDIGFRGLLVKRINSENELKNYLQKYPINTIIQEFIDYKNECGIFYHRIPGQKSGSITSITLKKYLTIIGDGISTVSELVLSDQRARIYFDIFTNIHGSDMNNIPGKKEAVVMSVIGNHSKGTQFIDGNKLINKALTNALNQLNNHINGWYYGRIDLKYESFKLIENQEQFKILEINGIISEPTHIYDASKNSYFGAVKSIGEHWKMIYQISKVNHDQKGVKYTNTLDFLREMKALKKYTNKIKKLSA